MEWLKRRQDERDEKCRTCHYYAYGSNTCDFYIITGERRGCPAGADCTRWEERGDISDRRLNLVRDVAFREKRGHGLDKSFFNAMQSLYDEGMSDRAIARELRVHVHTVERWRKYEGLVSQVERRKRGKENGGT
jgi:hypothetical protein